MDSQMPLSAVAEEAHHAESVGEVERFGVTTRLMAVGYIASCLALATCVVVPWILFTCAWMVYLKHTKEPCDQPLHSWLGTYLVYTLVMPCWKESVTRAFCCWSREQEDEVTPFRVKCMKFILDSVPFAWMVFARVLLARSATCAETSPALYHFVDWYSWFMLGLYMFGCGVSMIGVSLLLWFTRNGGTPLLWLARHGFLHMANAADPNTINRIETVQYSDGLFADAADPDDPRPSGECCICLEPYDEMHEIKRTRCGHFMHRKCLQEWLGAARTCPACRTDLEQAHKDSDGV